MMAVGNGCFMGKGDEGENRREDRERTIEKEKIYKGE